MADDFRLPRSGQFSPLRYPGGKGKVAGFVTSIIRQNDLSDGLYVEPYAGGAGVAWELLLTGVVRRIWINDISQPIYAFWDAVLNSTDALCSLIEETPVTLENWDAQKDIMRAPDGHENLALGFAMFFLNRTNRSGILNGGVIGGRAQTGEWKIDARYNKSELISRIVRIAAARNRVTLTRLDAVELLKERSGEWPSRTLVYLDPPYYVKGGQLYYNFYHHADHEVVAGQVRKLSRVHWLVSYDNAAPIRALYEGFSELTYSIGYSARKRTVGEEVMYFSPSLSIPDTHGQMLEIERKQRVCAT